MPEPDDLNSLLRLREDPYIRSLRSIVREWASAVPFYENFRFKWVNGPIVAFSTEEDRHEAE